MSEAYPLAISSMAVELVPLLIRATPGLENGSSVVGPVTYQGSLLVASLTFDSISVY